MRHDKNSMRTAELVSTCSMIIRGKKQCSAVTMATQTKFNLGDCNHSDEVGINEYATNCLLLLQFACLIR